MALVQESTPQPDPVPVQGKTVKTLVSQHLKRTRELFTVNQDQPLQQDEAGQKLKLACKLRDEYAAFEHLAAPPAASAKSGPTTTGAGAAGGAQAAAGPARPESKSSVAKLLDSIPATPAAAANSNTALVAYQGPGTASGLGTSQQKAIMRVIEDKGNGSAAVSRRLASKWPKPKWHAPWKMYRVISGHLGWVRSVAVDPSNEWFATGSADRTIKIWDLASGQLKLTLTGHIEQVMGLAISDRHPYMFSCGMDKQVKCWDLEQNKVIRSYHGHLSGVYCTALHPKLDVLFTGGRDSVCRVWDIRTKLQVYCLSGHEQTVACILSQPGDPQVITGSYDSTIRLWDLRTGKTMSTLTFHKKGVRAMALHPEQNAFAAASADNIKKYELPEGGFLHNMLQQQHSIVNSMAVNADGVMCTGGANGSVWWWDWISGHCFQQNDTLVQPGSLEAESTIYAMAFDQSGSRLISCEGDKTIKMWRPDEDATPDTHPGLAFKPPKEIRRF